MCLPIEANGNELHYMSTASELLPQINSFFFFFFFPNARVEIQWGPFFLLSLGANRASQLSTWNIWTTRQISSTCAFDKVHQGAICVCLGARDELRISINTEEFFLVFVGVVRSHQIPMILLGPSRWTVIPSGHHQHCATWVDIADGTKRIVVLEIFVKRIKRQLVFSAIYQSSVLNAVLVLIVLWGLWKAKVVRCASIVSVKLPSRRSKVEIRN